MNSNCPYCTCPDRYDLEPAEELNTVRTKYVDGDTVWGKKTAVHENVKLMGHRSKHPVRDQPQFHVPCQNVG